MNSPRPQEHQHSALDFRTPSADLRRWSPWIFACSLLVVMLLTWRILAVRLPEHPLTRDTSLRPPVVMQLQNIPPTRQLPDVPAPAFPTITDGAPIEVDDTMLDDITIEDTSITQETPIAVPVMPSAGVPDAGEIEDEIFEYYAVEEQPRRLRAMTPVYPPAAERAGIEGAVTLRVLVTTKGAVDSVIVVDGPAIFRQSAIDAANATVFSPARHNDRPVACWVIMPYRFSVE